VAVSEQVASEQATERLVVSKPLAELLAVS